MPGACSLSPHIVAREAGLDVAIEKVNTREQRTAGGVDFRTINPKGYVPALQLDNGEVLTESAIVVQYLADQNPTANLIPPAGSLERYRVQEWLHFIATELHKTIGALFNPKLSDDARKSTLDTVMSKLALVEKHLTGREFMMGSHFTVADAYLFTVVNWTGFLKIDISSFPTVSAYLKRVGQRPAVQAALKAEGLLQ
jgi:glutathione S-transferase